MATVFTISIIHEKSSQFSVLSSQRPARGVSENSELIA